MRTIAIGTALTAALLIAPFARAETADYDTVDHEGAMRVAPARAFELTFGEGYHQGFGQGSSKNEKLGDLGRAGLSMELGLGYRINPHFAVAFYMEGARYTNGSSVPREASSWGAAAGIEGTYHFMPFSRIDPWIGIGHGVRGYLVDRSDPGTKALLGLDVARLRVGADFKVGSAFSIGPVVSASLTRFGGYHSSETSHPENIEDRGWSTFVFAGLQGRIDIGGKQVKERSTLASR